MCQTIQVHSTREHKVSFLRKQESRTKMILKDTITLITGASTGIGQATAVAFAKLGSHGIITGRNQAGLDETATQIEAVGGTSHIIIADLSKLDGIKHLIQETKNYTKTLDHIINIAGIWHGKDTVYAGKTIDTFDQQVILDTYMVGLTAPTLLVHGLLDAMPDGSSIINLSGTFEDGGKGWVPYYTSKRALEDLTIALADDLAPRSIRVNCISPSDTATPNYAKFFPEYMSQAIDPTAIASQITELCSTANPSTRKVIVMKKDADPKEEFHS